MKPICVYNGPNLNLLGAREPEIYGYQSLSDIRKLIESRAQELKVEIDFRQSNVEGELIGWIQEARRTRAGIIINPAAYAHTSLAIRDALVASELPIIEVHLSNNYKREAFRQTSFISPVAVGVISGLGPDGYIAALEKLVALNRTYAEDSEP